MRKISTHYFGQKIGLLLLLFTVVAQLTYAQTNYYVSPTGNNLNNGLSAATAKLTIQNAVSVALDGDIINVANGTYTLTATLSLNHSLSIIGESEAGVIINTTGTPAGAWAINPNKSNTSLSNLTIVPNGISGGFPIHASSGNGTIITNINLSHITINGSKKTAFDFNGIDNLTVSYLTATGSTSGNGVQFSGCKNVNASHLTTSGNAWGSLAVYVSKSTGRGSDNVVIDATTSSFAESIGVYNQDEFGFISTNITVNGYSYAVQNTAAVGYTYYRLNKTAAIASANAFTDPALSSIKQIIANQFEVTPGFKIQTAINAAKPGDVILVFPGNYIESAPGSTLFNGTTYVFGLFIPAAKPGLNIIGVDASGVPVNSYSNVVANVQLNATNNFGPSGIFVEGDNATITGLNVYLDPAGGQNKTVEVLGENFTMKNCRLSDGNSLYINDWRYDAAANVSHITKYWIEGNSFEAGTSLDISSGAGKSGAYTDRKILNNYFDAAGGNWAMVSFNGSGTGVPWFVYSVGGAVITGNSFVNGTQYIRHRGTLDNSQFNWNQYWTTNSFDKSVITLSDEASFTPRTFSYAGTYGTFTNVKRIGSVIQAEIKDVAQTGDLVNVGTGTYAENVIVNKEVEIRGKGQSATKVLPALSSPDCGGNASAGSLCAGASNVFLIQANNVTIDQLTINGDNPSLTSGKLVAGSDIDARNGIITDHTTGLVFNNLTVHHVTIQNIYLRAVYASSGGTFNFNNNLVFNVQGNPSSIALFNFGGSGSFTGNTVINANDGIVSNWSKGTTYTGNIVIGSGSGIHTDNNGGSGGIGDVISNNQILNSKPDGYGIWVFAPYRPVTVQNNSISGVAVGLASAGQQLPVTTTFTGNTVDGLNKAGSTGVYVTTDLFGYGTSDVSANFTNNIIKNNADGFYFESEAGKTLTVVANNNSLSGNTNSNVTQGTGASGAGTFVADMNCNWWGTSVGSAINATISGTGITHNTWLSDGTDADVSVPGFQPAAGTCAGPISNVQVSAQKNVSCFGASDGSATISFENGVGAVSYVLDGGAATVVSGHSFDLTGLTSGTHTITLTDLGGNSASINITISEPALLNVTHQATPILCNGGVSDLSFSATGGTAPYQLANQGNGDLLVKGMAEGVTYHSNLTAGTYTYVLTDAHNCQTVFTETITEPTILSVSATATSISCNQPSSVITVSATDGTAPYSGTGNYTVSAGTYTYTVTDANGCTASATITPAYIPDTEKPQVTAPKSYSVPNTPGQCGATILNIGNPIVSDNCGIASVTNNHPSNFYPVGTTVVTWTVTDLSGNVNDTATQKITVIDNELPTISVTNLTVGNSPGVCGATVNLASPIAGDNCGVAGITNDHPSTFFPVGTTNVVWTVTDAHGWTNTAVQTVTVNDTEKPTVLTQNITVYLDATGNAVITAAQVDNGSIDNCSIASYSLSKSAFNSSNLGDNTVTLTVTDASGNSNSNTAIVTVKNKLVTIVAGIPDQSLCANVAGNYTIPAITVSGNCGGVIANYQVVSNNVVTRTGTGTDASGAFNTGVSTVTWTVTDVCGNTIVSNATVTINAIPAAPSIAVSNEDAFCNKITITANTATSGATYQWTSCNSVFSNAQQISLGQANGNGVYSVSVTVNGCISGAANYTFQKDLLAASYTILATKEVELGENNTVASGSVGVIAASGEASFRKNSSVSSPGSFVKAKHIDKDGSNIIIANPIYAAATGIILPVMLQSTANTNGLPNKEVAKNSTTTVNGNFRNLTLKKGSNTTLTGSIFGSIKVEQGARVTFTASTINIDKLDVAKGPRTGYSYVRFAPDTKVLVSGSVNIGSQVYVNPDNNKVTFYIGNKRSDDAQFTVKGGDTKVTANVYAPKGKLKITGGYAYGDYGNGRGDSDNDDDDDRYYSKGNNYVYMTGLFIAEEVESKGKNVIWNSFDCSAAPVALITAATAVNQASATEEKAVTTTEELKVTVMPNPSTTYFTLKFESRYQTPVELRVMDGSGRVIDARSKIASNSSIQIGHNYSSGTYYAEMIQGTKRKVVQLIKGRGSN